MKRKNKLLFLSFLPVILVFLATFFLSDQIPLHNDIFGNVTRTGSKYELYIIACIICVTGLLFYLYLNFSKIGNDQTSNSNSSESSLLICLIFLNLYLILIILKNIFSDNISMNLNSIVFIMIGILLMILSRRIMKVPMNNIVGLRLKWTMTSDKQWKISQIMSARYLKSMGVIILANTLFNNSKYATLINILILVFCSLLLFVKSYFDSIDRK